MNNSKPVPIYDVSWEGPYQFNEEELGQRVKTDHVLYQLYGRHPVYGGDCLLYIGMTHRGARRLGEHKSWVQYEQDVVNFRVATVGHFSSWEEWSGSLYPVDASIPVDAIEKLLIYANQPCYNTQYKNSFTLKDNLHVFNTHHYGALLPETSSLYFYGRTVNFNFPEDE